MSYYNYCTSLLLEFWMIPFQVEYMDWTKTIAGSICNQCRLHTFGSILYAQCVALLGFGISLYDIYYLISPYYQQKVKSPRLQHDLELMIGTVSALVYLVLMLGLLLENYHMLVPWLVLDIISIIINLALLQEGYPRLLLALFVNNILQIGCVFLKFLRSNKLI